jgi:hypothetical protein
MQIILASVKAIADPVQWYVVHGPDRGLVRSQAALPAWSIHLRCLHHSLRRSQGEFSEPVAATNGHL